jgi:hypothetical protein
MTDEESKESKPLHTLMHELVERQAGTTFLSALGRTIDRVVEELTLDLLKDDQLRKELKGLIGEAMKKAVTDMQLEATREEARRQRWKL